MLAILYVIDRMQKKRPLYSQKELAAELQSLATYKREGLPTLVNQIFNGRILVSPAQYTEFQMTLVSFMEQEKIDRISITQPPMHVFYEFQHKLVDIFGEYGYHAPQKRIPISEIAEHLNGMWRLFYVPSLDLETNVLATNVAFFWNRGPLSIAANSLMFGAEKSKWFGTCFRTDDKHIYINLSQMSGQDIAFMTAVRPDKYNDSAKMAGLMMLLDPYRRSALSKVRGMITTVWFGTKCSVDECKYVNSVPDAEEKKALSDAIGRAQSGKPISEGDEVIIQKFYRKVDLTVEEFRREFPDMVLYLNEFKEVQPIISKVHALEELLSKWEGETSA